MHIMKQKSIIENTAFSSAEKVIQVVASLIVIPFTLARLGMSAYGTWVLFGSIAGCFMLAQFGMSASFEKFIAEFRSKNDYQSLCSLISTAFYSLLFLGVIIGFIGWMIAPILIKTLLPHQDLFKTAPALKVFIAISMIGLAGQIFISVPRGFMRFDISSGINIIGKIIEVLMTLVLLTYNPTINSLLWVVFCSVVVVIIGHCIVAVLIVGTDCINPFYWKWYLLKKMFLFGMPLQISFFAMWVTQNLDKFIISRFFGPVNVALYDVGAKIPLLLRQAPMMLFAVLVPRISEHSANLNDEQLRALYLKGCAFVTIASFTAISIFLPVVDQILSVWLHTAPQPLSIAVFKILLIASMVQIIAGIGSSMVRGIGKPHLEASANSIMALLNIALSVSLGYLFGVYGVVWGTAVSLVIGTCIFLVVVNRRVGIDTLDFIRKIILLPLFAATGAVAAGFLLLPLVSLVGVSGRFLQFTQISIQGIFAISMSLLVYRKFRIRFP